MNLRGNKPDLHICNRWCAVRCLLGQHHRADPESKCRCCRVFDKNTAHELSRSQRSEGIQEVTWWQEERPVPSPLEKRLMSRARRLLEALGQRPKVGVYPGDDIAPAGS